MIVIGQEMSFANIFKDLAIKEVNYNKINRKLIAKWKEKRNRKKKTYIEKRKKEMKRRIKW